MSYYSVSFVRPEGRRRSRRSQAYDNAAHFITLGMGEGAGALILLDDALTDLETHNAADTTYETLALTARTTLGTLPTAATQAAAIRSAAYDDATRRLYVTEAGNRLRVQVYQIAGASTPPPSQVDCQLSDWSAWQAVTPWSACVDSTQSQQQRRTRTIDVPPAHGGAACSPTEEPQTATQPCTLPPPVNTLPACTLTCIPVAGQPWQVTCRW